MPKSTDNTRAKRAPRAASAAAPRRRSPAPPVDDTVAEGDSAESVDSSDIGARMYRAVCDSVMSQRLKPGTKLPEAPLC